MCLTVKRKTPPKNWDGYIYKCFEIEYYHLISPFRSYRYYPDNCVEVDITTYIVKGNEINKGIHAFNNKKDAKNYLYYNKHEVCIKIKVKRSDIVAWGQEGDIVLNKLTIPTKLYNKAVKWTKQSKKSRIIGDS